MKISGRDVRPAPEFAVPSTPAILLDDNHALQHLAEHGVLTIQSGGLHGGDEELRAVKRRYTKIIYAYDPYISGTGSTFVEALQRHYYC